MRPKLFLVCVLVCVLLTMQASAVWACPQQIQAFSAPVYAAPPQQIQAFSAPVYMAPQPQIQAFSAPVYMAPQPQIQAFSAPAYPAPQIQAFSAPLRGHRAQIQAFSAPAYGGSVQALVVPGATATTEKVTTRGLLRSKTVERTTVR